MSLVRGQTGACKGGPLHTRMGSDFRLREFRWFRWPPARGQAQCLHRPRQAFMHERFVRRVRRDRLRASVPTYLPGTIAHSLSSASHLPVHPQAVTIVGASVSRNAFGKNLVMLVMREFQRLSQRVHWQRPLIEVHVRVSGVFMVLQEPHLLAASVARGVLLIRHAAQDPLV